MTSGGDIHLGLSTRVVNLSSEDDDDVLKGTRTQRVVVTANSKFSIRKLYKIISMPAHDLYHMLERCT